MNYPTFAKNFRSGVCQWLPVFIRTLPIVEYRQCGLEDSDDKKHDEFQRAMYKVEEILDPKQCEHSKWDRGEPADRNECVVCGKEGCIFVPPRTWDSEDPRS